MFWEWCLPLQALNNRGRRPLHLACRSGHLDIAITLLENGADPSARDGNGMQVSVDKYDVGVLCSKKYVDDGSSVETLASGGEISLLGFLTVTVLQQVRRMSV